MSLSPNQITTANAGWRNQFRFRGSRHRPSVTEFRRWTSLQDYDYTCLDSCRVGGDSCRHRGAVILPVPLTPHGIATAVPVAFHSRCGDVGSLLTHLVRRHGLFSVVGRRCRDLWAVPFLDAQVLR